MYHTIKKMNLYFFSDTHISASHRDIHLAETEGNFIMLALKCKKKRSNPFKLDYANIMNKVKVHMVHITRGKHRDFTRNTMQARAENWHEFQEKTYGLHIMHLHMAHRYE